MKAIQLRPYQIKAMEAIQGALDSGQKHMVVEMASGTGKGFVFAKTVELLHKQTLYKKKMGEAIGKVLKLPMGELCLAADDTPSNMINDTILRNDILI